MANNATRRSLLKAATGVAAYGAGVAALSAGAAVVSSGTAKGATSGVSPELTRLIAECERVEAFVQHFYNTNFNPKCDEANRRYFSLPHVTAENRPGAYPAVFTTENSTDVTRCQGIVSIPRDQQSQDPGWQITYKAARRIVAGVKQRERAWKRIERETEFDVASAQEEPLSAAEQAALDAVENFPAASLADMKAKLGVMVKRERSEVIIVEMLTADLDRLTKREG